MDEDLLDSDSIMYWLILCCHLYRIGIMVSFLNESKLK